MWKLILSGIVLIFIIVIFIRRKRILRREDESVYSRMKRGVEKFIDFCCRHGR